MSTDYPFEDGMFKPGEIEKPAEQPQTTQPQPEQTTLPANTNQTGNVVGNIPGLGSVVFPVAGGGVQDIGGGIGAPRDGGARSHKGCDIFGAHGTAIVAAVSGRVVKMGWNNVGGERIGIVDAQGNYHYYAHLSGYAEGLSVGDVVNAGTTIGYLGNTGNAEGTDPHLHYSINEGGGTGKPLVDPVALFKNNALVTVDESTAGNLDSIPSEYESDEALSEDPLTELTPEEAIDVARNELPGMIAFMEIPELQDIFVRAVREGRSTNVGWIQNELAKTDWWKSRNEKQRLLVALKETDPGQYREAVLEVARGIRTTYVQFGVAPPAGDPFTDLSTNTPLYRMAESFLLTGMQPQNLSTAIQRTIATGLEFDPLDTTPSGELGTTMAGIQSLAGSYFVNISDQKAFEFAQKIMLGDLTTEGVSDMVRDMAISKFSYDDIIVNRIKAGYTPDQLFSEHRNVLAQTLDIDPQTIDFNDPKFSSVITGGPEQRSMTVAETRRWIRSSDMGARSREVQRDGMEVYNGLRKIFGIA